jgi:hypothetical protein
MIELHWAWIPLIVVVIVLLIGSFIRWFTGSDLGYIVQFIGAILAYAAILIYLVYGGYLLVSFLINNVKITS